uniref:Uncharacterized protein n=1 Tax=Anguilla anguilla TaxID=7936 RepID=A0A0E9W6Y3_ANGAN
MAVSQGLNVSECAGWLAGKPCLSNEVS